MINMILIVVGYIYYNSNWILKPLLIYQYVSVIDRESRSHELFILLFVDIEKAFDHVPRK